MDLLIIAAKVIGIAVGVSFILFSLLYKLTEWTGTNIEG